MNLFHLLNQLTRFLQKNKILNMADFKIKTLDQPVNFGLYKDRKINIKELIDMNPEYVTWLLNNWKGFKLFKKVYQYYLGVVEAKLNLENRS